MRWRTREARVAERAGESSGSLELSVSDGGWRPDRSDACRPGCRDEGARALLYSLLVNCAAASAARRFYQRSPLLCL